MRIRLPRLALLMILAGATTALGGCFSPKTPPCAFTCISAGSLCPDDYTCGADGLCHRDGAEGVCGLKPPYGGGEAGAAGGAGGGAGGGGGEAGGNSGRGGSAAGGAGGA